MPDFQITYHTCNKYSSIVPVAILEFLVFPAELPNQKINNFHFDHTPSSKYYFGENIFGYKFLRFRCENLINDFSFTLKASITKEITNPFDFSALSPEEELPIITSDEYMIDHYLFLRTNEYTHVPQDFQFPDKAKNETVFEYTKRINEFVYNEIDYDSLIDDPNRLLKDTIHEKRGVCQDLAHLMIGILRKNNIPARYVSGYLNPGEEMVGAGAVHAWVEVLIPNGGWIGFDPTNNLLEDYHYIKIADGLDISDCSTLKGVIKGIGSNRTEYQVLVEEQNKDMNQ